MTSARNPALESMRRHVDALYTRDANGRLLIVNDGVGEEAAPRFWLGRTPEGCIWRFGASLPADVADALDRVCRTEPPAASADDREPVHRDEYLQILAAHGEIAKVWGGPCYRDHAPSAPNAGSSARKVVTIDASNVDDLEAHLPDWMDVALQWQPMVVVLDGSYAVSVCASVRRTDEAHEAGVDTAPAFRQRGFARRAVAAWIAEVRRLGVEPLYSTSWDNVASQALATSLGLTMFGSDFQVG